LNARKLDLSLWK